MGAAAHEQLFCEAGEAIGRQEAADDGATLICSFLENGPKSLFQKKKPTPPINQNPKQTNRKTPQNKP